MKCLKEPLLNAQLKEGMDSSESSPLRKFAIEILVRAPLSTLSYAEWPVALLTEVLVEMLCPDRNVLRLCPQGVLCRIGESIPELLFHHLLKKKEPGFLEEDARYPVESLACLAYLLFVHHMATDMFPAVFR